MTEKQLQAVEKAKLEVKEMTVEELKETVKGVEWLFCNLNVGDDAEFLATVREVHLEELKTR